MFSHPITYKKISNEQSCVNTDLLCAQGQATPLHAAALAGHVEVAKQLVEAKADVDARDEVGTYRIAG